MQIADPYFFYRNSKLRNLKLQNRYRFLCKTEEKSIEHLMCYSKAVEVFWKEVLSCLAIPKNEHKMLHSRIFCSRNSILIIDHVL